MNRNIKLFLTSLIFLTTTSVSSQTVSEKGIASIELDRTTCREGRPTDRNKHFEAIDKAKNLLGKNMFLLCQVTGAMLIMHLNKHFYQS